MGVKVEKTGTPVEDISYPCILLHPGSGTVVLFFESGAGLRLYPYLGAEVEKDWKPVATCGAYWTKFDGKFSLSNS